ncbi:hypothetical protein EVAR_8181_1 [Eumeta japonica]|uniref:Uncharacterized protein n=1 Tax=Eumeta variegata TaxID=151549 RepID=A0A4C1TIX0_EUMVA|nr:hypothetical protein EVAR_8181_1 [Eumeta japonica]
MRQCCWIDTRPDISIYSRNDIEEHGYSAAYPPICERLLIDLKMKTKVAAMPPLRKIFESFARLANGSISITGLTVVELYNVGFSLYDDSRWKRAGRNGRRAGHGAPHVCAPAHSARPQAHRPCSIPR